MNKWVLNVIYLTLGSMLLLSSFAFAVNGRTTYQAKIYKPDGLPLESVSVNFRFTVLDPSSSCVLYVEDYAAVNMIGSGGLTSFSLGMGSRSYPTSGPTTFANVFDNSTSSFVCQSPGVYNPVPTDNRKIVMQFNEGGGWQTLPAMAINSVPYAMYASKSQNSEKLNGKADSAFVEYATLASLSCQPNEAIQFNGATFACISVGSGVTSSSVTTALGYTPANATSFTTLSSTVTSVSSSVYSVSATVGNLNTAVTSLSNSVAASFATITSSQWVSSGTNISYASGMVGIGTANPVTRLDVSGGVRIGAESSACGAAFAGTLRYNLGNVEYCNGTSWSAFGVAGAGITLLNGSASGSQIFAAGITGTAFNISSVNGVHSFNIPLAASGAVTAGLLSNADYVTFTNKLNATSSAVNAALGYTAANQTSVATSLTALSATDTALATSITALTTTANTNSSSITALTSTVNSNSTSITGLTTSATNLTASVNTNSASITALTSTVNTHTTSITGLTASATNLTASVNALTTSATNLTSTVNTHTASITALSSSGNTNAASITALTASVGTSFSAVATTTTALSTSITALIASATNLTALVNTNSASITALTSTVNTHTTSLTSLAASMSALTSSQWTTSGSSISYMAGKVGVGVSNPAYTLDVSSAIRAGNGTGSVAQGSDGNAYIELREPDNAGTPYIDFANDNAIDYDARLVLTNDDALQLNGAFLGINILPTAGVTIAAGTSTYAPLKFTSGTLLASPQSGTMEFDGYNYYLTDGANQRRMIATGSSQGAIDNTSQINSTSNLTLNPTGIVVASSSMQVSGNLSANGNFIASGNIVANGSVGIGQASPGEKLDVNGNMRIGSGDSNYIAFRGVTGDGPGNYNHTYIGERFYSAGESSELFLFKGNDSDNASGPDRIRLAGGNLVFDTYASPDAPSGAFETVATSPMISTKMIIKGNGNVGIGTTSPNHQLETTGNALIGSGGYPALYLRDTNWWMGTLQATETSWPDSDSFVFSTPAGRPFVFQSGAASRTEGVARMYIDTNNGNVGIGTTTPSSLNGWGKVLDVFGTAHSKIVATQATANVSVTAGVYAHGLTGNGYAGYPQNWGGVGLVGTETAHDVGIMTNNTTRMSVTSGGLVGINTISPQAQLDVNGSVRATYFAFQAPPGDPAPTISTRTVPAGQGAANEKTELILFHSNDFNNGSGTDQITLRAPALSFQTYASATVATINDNGGYNERMYITPNGNVGVNTTNPSEKLSVKGDGNYIAKETVTGIDGAIDGILKYGFWNDLASGGTGNTNRWHGIDATISAGTGAANKMLFKMFQGGNNNTAGAYVMALQGDGNVGIGTTAPSTKLEVAGGDINVPTGRISFNSGVLTGTAGMASTDGGAVFGEHDVNTETSRLVIEVYDNQNDQIVLRTNAPSGGANVDMMKVQYDQVMLAPTTGNVGIGVAAAPTSKLQVNGGIKQPNYGQIIVTFDGTTRTVSMPAFLTAAYMDAHQDDTFTWRAVAPQLKDNTSCASGPHPNYFFEGFDTTWNGTYHMTIGKVNASVWVAEIEWQGWGSNLRDGANALVGTSSNEGRVQATLAFNGTTWYVEHMGGQVGAVTFACH